jgi:hypothetical protein
MTTADDFRRIALSLEGAEERAHMGAADFRVGGRIFATLASQAEGYGNLVLNPAVQQEFVEEASDLFTPIAGGWGRMGMTHIRLAAADEETLRGALTQAWKLRVEKKHPCQACDARQTPLRNRLTNQPRRGSSVDRVARQSARA